MCKGTWKERVGTDIPDPIPGTAEDTTPAQAATLLKNPRERKYLTGGPPRLMQQQVQVREE